MKRFSLKSEYKPTEDQNNAISKLVSGYENNLDKQVLLGVTGSGKTFTIANVIERLQVPALIISHNKTLAAQLYQEFRDFFPDNAISYFVSYYDYYQPEAYIPSTDTYIEKDAGINELIDKLRLAATTNLLTRKDTIIIASVSCIYNIGSPIEYKKFTFNIFKGLKVTRDQVIQRLLDLQYERSDYGFHRGTFRIRGDYLDIYPAYQDEAYRLELGIDNIKNIESLNPISGIKIKNDIESILIFPTKHYISDTFTNTGIYDQIKNDCSLHVDKLKKEGKIIEADRLEKRVKYDLEMIKETGYVKGIENYSRYFDGRNPGDPPYTLLDYFNSPYKKDWLVVIDESHITIPQIRGMYNGDLSRKRTLIDFGFRLPASLDNRPLTFDEFLKRIPNFIATSATPSEWELNMAKDSYLRCNKKEIISENGLTQQLLRPTGIPDPKVTIRKTKTQVSDVTNEILKRKKIGERCLITTLTKKTAEDLSNFLKEKNINVHYLHSDIKTLERSDILDDLRKGNYDCIVGVNLLREGLDLPEVSLVAILDADKEGFLRSEVSLIQTMGRAARHVSGEVILYADVITGSIKRAVEEVRRRRKLQIDLNKKMNIIPKSIEKPIREKLIISDTTEDFINDVKSSISLIENFNYDSLLPTDRKKFIKKLKKEMRIAATDLNFELAIKIRDKIKELEE